METFAEWLEKQMNRLGWNQSEMARRAGVERATINRALNQTRRPEPRTCRGIARALAVDEDDVLSRAGHRSKAADDTGMSEWIAAGRKLTAHERAEFLEWVFAKIARSDKEPRY